MILIEGGKESVEGLRRLAPLSIKGSWRQYPGHVYASLLMAGAMFVGKLLADADFSKQEVIMIPKDEDMVLYFMLVLVVVTFLHTLKYSVRKLDLSVDEIVIHKWFRIRRTCWNDIEKTELSTSVDRAQLRLFGEERRSRELINLSALERGAVAVLLRALGAEHAETSESGANV